MVFKSRIYSIETVEEAELWNLSRRIIGACIEVHKALGPGLLESIYSECLSHELQLRELNFTREAQIPISYKGIVASSNLRADFIVEERVILELKAVREILPVFEAQILSYIKLANIELGLLINFNVPLLKEGVHRFRLNYGKVNDPSLIRAEGD